MAAISVMTWGMPNSAAKSRPRARSRLITMTSSPLGLALIALATQVPYRVLPLALIRSSSRLASTNQTAVHGSS